MRQVAWTLVLTVLLAVVVGIGLRGVCGKLADAFTTPAEGGTIMAKTPASFVACTGNGDEDKAAKVQGAVLETLMQGGVRVARLTFPLPFAELDRPAGDWVASNVTFKSGGPGFTVPNVTADGITISANVFGPKLAKGEKAAVAVKRGVQDALGELGLDAASLAEFRAFRESKAAGGDPGVTKLRPGATADDRKTAKANTR